MKINLINCAFVHIYLIIFKKSEFESRFRFKFFSWNLWNVVISQVDFKRVKRFRYLLSIIADDEVISHDIKERITKDRKCYETLLPLMKSKDLSIFGTETRYWDSCPKFLLVPGKHMFIISNPRPLRERQWLYHSGRHTNVRNCAIFRSCVSRGSPGSQGAHFGNHCYVQYRMKI